MKKRHLRLLFLSGILLTLLTACEYDFIAPAPPVPIPPAGDTISFSQDIQPFFTAECVRCHPSFKPDLSAGKSYNALTSGGYIVENSPETSKLYQKCQPGGSMAGYVTPANLALLYRWIYAGAKND